MRRLDRWGGWGSLGQEAAMAMTLNFRSLWAFHPNMSWPHVAEIQVPLPRCGCQRPKGTGLGLIRKEETSH